MQDLKVGQHVYVSAIEDLPPFKGVITEIPEIGNFVYVTVDLDYVGHVFGDGDYSPVECNVNQITVCIICKKCGELTGPVFGLCSQCVQAEDAALEQEGLS